jgi:hypothetical protein
MADETTSSTLHVRLPHRLATAVVAAAERDCRTVAEFTRQALLASVRKAGLEIRDER